MVSFLDLPLNVRHRIYAFSVLIRSCPIELSRPHGYNRPARASAYGFTSTQRQCLYTWRKSGGDMSLEMDRPDCVCPKLPLQLLLVSRAVYQEVFSAFYSRNKFLIRLHNTGDFESLHLSQKILNTMTSLLIRLNSWPCPRGHEEAYPDGSHCLTCKTPTADASLPLDITSQAGQALLYEWRKFAERLALSISATQLKLTIICDVTDKTSGMAILEPLLRLPTIKQCVIRLGQHFDYELYELARKASFRAQGSYSEIQGSFPFQRLPKELRLQILKYTHLGYHNSYSEDDRFLQIERNKLVQSSSLFLHQRKTCCRKCTETLIDCCCVPIRAAYSMNCECRQIPFELSLVNKEMRADVIEVLLSQNCFDFLQDPEETISFLSNFPQKTWKYFRRIQFRFSEQEVENWDQLGYYEKLTSLVIFIKNNFNLERLSITIVVESYDLGCFVDEDEDTRFIYNVYCDITQALSLLHELEDIHFKLGWFIDLEPLMKQAILTQQHPRCSSNRQQAVSLGVRRGPAFALPSWYQEADFTRG
ncbi:hypothetical protein B0O99DRAFT_626434 [Bisporella sp. PMI_857]|nr:hypothetical protein B0O99DRAFT_626434 [Bisporella sp. PMI_857]